MSTKPSSIYNKLSSWHIRYKTRVTIDFLDNVLAFQNLYFVHLWLTSSNFSLRSTNASGLSLELSMAELIGLAKVYKASPTTWLHVHNSLGKPNCLAGHYTGIPRCWEMFLLCIMISINLRLGCHIRARVNMQLWSKRKEEPLWHLKHPPFRVERQTRFYFATF